MILVESIECNCFLSDVIKLRGLRPGMIIYFANHQPMIVGDCTPRIRPTTSDGGIGWDWESDYCLLLVTKIEYYTLFERTSNELIPYDKVVWTK